MNNEIAKSGSNNQPAKSLDEEWRLMNAALERLGPVRSGVLDRSSAGAKAGRLIVALDLTSSRAASLRQAQKATAAMFEAIKGIGTVAVKMIYYRGARELKATAWHDDAGAVSRLMLGLSCKAGETQIARVLRLVLAEKEKISGVVFVGDQCEEDGWELTDLADKMGKKGIPIFVFHEIRDDDVGALRAQGIFRPMAEYSGGVYTEFCPDAGEIMRELLLTVAAFSAAGHGGLKQVAAAKTPEARQLRGSLLLLSDGKGDRQ
jgi:hypothetical protein